MESLDLTPRYSSNEATGRCVKCLAEEILNSCLRELLVDTTDNAELQKKYEALVAFLESDELQNLCNESEKYLSEGKDVSVRLSLEAGKPRFELYLK